ncbi:hypothetical protein COO60DRAFT_223416 [Scenedesmus sp. NREL 46B-D3]|nr:hypothetical protein COO60DRAFT_223416 [Scenedesmus sp. NREL 46B-D3]
MKTLLHARSSDFSYMQATMYPRGTVHILRNSRCSSTAGMPHAAFSRCLLSKSKGKRRAAVMRLDAPVSSSAANSTGHQPHLQPDLLLQPEQHSKGDGHDSQLLWPDKLSSLSDGSHPASSPQQQHQRHGDVVEQHSEQLQQHEQKRKQRPAVSQQLCRQCCALLQQGRCQQADSQLWGAIMAIRSLQQLQAAADTLTAANLLRPAAVVALLVQLGLLVTRQQHQQQQVQLQDARQQQAQQAVETNRQRQLRKKQHQQENLQRELAAQEEAKAAAAQQARHALIERLQQQPESERQQRLLQRVMEQEQEHEERQQRQRMAQQQGQQQLREAGDLVRQHMSSLTQQVQDALHLDQPAATSAATTPASASPAGSAQQQQQQQHRRLLKRLLAQLSDADVTQLSPQQLGLLPHWLAKLGVAEPALLARLQQAGSSSMSEPARLVPMLWGFAKSQQAGSSSGNGSSGKRGGRAASKGQQGHGSGSGSVTVARQVQAAAVAAAAGVAAGQVPLQHQPAELQPQLARPSLPPAQQQHAAAAAAAAAVQSPGVPDPAFVSAWLEASAPSLAGFSASELAASIYSLALLGHVPPQPWQEAFFAASLATLRTASAQDLSNMLWAMGTLQLQPPGIRPAAEAAAAAAAAGVALDDHAGAVDAAAAAASAAAAAGAGPAVAWQAAEGAAGSSLGVAGSSWWGQFQVAAIAVLWDFTGVGIANLIWGAARLGLAPSPQVGRLLLWQAQRGFAGMDLQLLSSCVWGVARLRLSPGLHWLHRMGRRVRHLAPSSITPNLASSLLLSFGALRYCPRVWLGRFLHTLHPHLPAFTPRDIANTYTAFERMLYVPKDDWLFDFQMAARLALPRCGAQELLCVARALSVLSSNVASYRVEPDFLAALLTRCAAIAAAEFSPADCANLAQSLVYLKAAPGTGLLAALTAAFSARISEAGDEDVVGLLWALGAFWRSSSECLWLRQHPELVQELLGRVGSSMGRLGPLQLKRVVAAAAAMGVSPGQPWLAAHEAAVVAQLPEMYGASLEQVLWCYRGLGYSASQGKLLQEALAARQDAQRRQQQVLQQQQQQQQQAAVAAQQAEQQRERQQ